MWHTEALCEHRGRQLPCALVLLNSSRESLVEFCLLHSNVVRQLNSTVPCRQDRGAVTVLSCSTHADKVFSRISPAMLALLCCAAVLNSTCRSTGLGRECSLIPTEEMPIGILGGLRICMTGRKGAVLRQVHLQAVDSCNALFLAHQLLAEPLQVFPIILQRQPMTQYSQEDVNMDY